MWQCGTTPEASYVQVRNVGAQHVIHLELLMNWAQNLGIIVTASSEGLALFALYVCMASL